MTRYLLFLLLLGSISNPVLCQPLKIFVHLDSSIHETLTGRLYIFSQPDTSKPVMDPDPFSPSPTFYRDVQDWNSGSTLVFEGREPGYPVSLVNINPGWYKFSAVMDVNTEERSNTRAPGNLYARKDARVEVVKGEEKEIHLYITNRFGERPFRETASIKVANMRSEMLSTFHKKPTHIKAAVILPESYIRDSNRVYPVVYIIPGWGGTHFDAQQKFATDRYGVGMGKEKIYVYLNPETQTPYGLHAFVDSRVNGPWGKALVREFRSWLATQYRITSNPNHHFVIGQSSGGYAALWLQMNYPDSFGACWAVSPDPVDFSNFTGVNIYEKNANFFYNAQGKERAFFFIEGKAQATLKQFIQVEHFMGDGGQMQSFEAEFGVPDKNGKPAQLFDRITGKVNTKLVKKWKEYDLGKMLLEKKRKLQPYASKIHVFAGAADNFLLQKAVEAFAEKAKQAGIPLVAELIPNADHWSIWSKSFTERMQMELDSRL
jgi:S-formylglutathione hydrolase FrmB